MNGNLQTNEHRNKHLQLIITSKYEFHQLPYTEFHTRFLYNFTRREKAERE